MEASSRYSFGMAQPGRTFTGATGYEYGFNNMRRDDEWNGTSATYDFGARLFDARIGRWWAVDPAFRRFPELSAYSYVANSPLVYIDPDGRKFVIATNLSEADQARVKALLEHMEKEMPELYNKLNSARVHTNDDGTQEVVFKGDERWEAAFDIIIEVGIKDTDGKTERKERKEEADKFQWSSGATYQLVPKVTTCQEGEAYRVEGNSKWVGVNEVKNTMLIEVKDPNTGEIRTESVPVTSVMDLKNSGLFRFVYSNKENVVHFRIYLDDFIPMENGGDGQIAAHEFGHIESMIDDPASLFFYRKAGGKGHSDGNPSGENAIKRENQYKNRKK